jgi:CHAT domain-containing protein
MVDMHAHDCLEPEVLAAYVDHGLSLAERARVEHHLASCRECTALLAGVVRTVAAIAPALPHAGEPAEAAPLVSRRALAAGAVAAAAVLAVLVAPSLVKPWLDRDTGLVGLAGNVGEHRSVLGRLTGGFPHAPLEAASAGGQDARTSGTDRVLLTAGRIRESVGEMATPARLHELGVSQLFERRYDDAAELLLSASRQQPANARYLNDVATVQLERARLGLRPDDLPRALAAADRARRLDPSLTEAWFNRALAMSALQLTDQAKVAWAEYLRRDSTSPWAGEARQRLDELSIPTPAHTWEGIQGRLQQSIDASTAEAAVRAQTTEARNFLENELLVKWADAVLAGNSGEAELDRLRVMAEAMFRVTGDALYSDVVSAIDRADGASREQLTTLARAHRAYADAAAVFSQDMHGVAAPRLLTARDALAAAGTPYQWRAALDHGASSYFLGQAVSVSSMLHELRATAARSNYRFLGGRASWQLGLAAFQEGRLADARGSYDETLQTFIEMGDQEQAAASHTLLSGVFFVLGDKVSEWRHRLSALSASAAIRSPRSKYSILAPLGFSLRIDDPQAALAIQDAMLAIATEWGRDAIVVDTLAQRSSTLIALGRLDEAKKQLSEARVRLANVSDTAFRNIFELPVLAAESELYRQTNPEQAVAAASRAIDTAIARGDRGRLPQFQLRLARANIVSGRLDEAERALVAGLAAFDETRAKSSGGAGISAFDEAWQLYETAVQLAIRRGDHERAFALAERGRMRNVATPSLASLTDVQSTQLRGQAIVALNQFEDELAIWLIRPSGTMVVRRPMTRADARQLVARQQEEIRLETRRPAASGVLFDELIRPLATHLKGVTRLTFVPDATYQDVSFAALWDRSSDGFAVEKWTLAAAPTVMLAAGSRASTPQADSILVLSTNPDEATARTIASAYPHADVVVGAAATGTRLLNGSSSVLHVAAPAQRNDSYPSWSQLRLSDEPGRKYSGAVAGRDIATRQMSSTTLVVLDELTEQSYRTAGTFDLATAFLAAGVPAVLGTLPGADERGSRELMVGFHRQLASQVPAAEALARVQRNALQQNGRRLGAWTALVIYGSDR